MEACVDRSDAEAPWVEGWVSCSLTADLLTLARDQQASMDLLLSGLEVDEATLVNRTASIRWSVFRALCRNASVLWNDEELVELGWRYLELDSIRSSADLGRLSGDPVECFRVLYNPGQHPVISCIEQLVEQQSRDRFRIELRMTPGHEPCPQYFLMRKGLLEAVPTVAGYPQASVEMTATKQGVVFEVRVHQLVGFVAMLRNRLQRISGYFLSGNRRLKAMQNLSQRQRRATNRSRKLDAKLAQLQTSEERFIEIFQSAPTAMLISSAKDYQVIDVNDKFLAATGYPREEVLSWIGAVPGVWANDGDRDSILTHVRGHGSSIEGQEIHLRHRDGHKMVALLSAKPVDLAGEPCIFWQAVDVTARKQNELELAEYRDHLEELIAERTRELERSLESLKQVERLASIGTLAAGIAHQINNPIASIRAAAEFALLCDDQPDALSHYREALATCVEQSDRCGLIVRNILRFSRDEAGTRSHVDLRQILLHSCKLVASYAREKGATIGLDEGESELPVLVNLIEIEQVFVNVLRNAIESGAGKTRVEVLARRLDTGAFVEIRDDGVGIDSAHLPFLFDPFYTTRLEHGGTGLGLSVAHGIVNAHGGAIRADTELDRGTAIQIQIPLATPGQAK